MNSRKPAFSDQRDRQINSLRNQLASLDLDIETMFKLFEEWQSLKTRSIKRFTITLSFILSLGWISGTDILTAKPLGIEFAGENPATFLTVLLIIHVGVFAYFLYQRSVDSAIRRAKLKILIKDFDKQKILKNEVDKILKEESVKEFRDLLSKANHSFIDKNDRNALKSYKTINFYEENLHKQRRKASIGEAFESIIISLIALIGAVFIICSYLMIPC